MPEKFYPQRKVKAFCWWERVCSPEATAVVVAGAGERLAPGHVRLARKDVKRCN